MRKLHFLSVTKLITLYRINKFLKRIKQKVVTEMVVTLAYYLGECLFVIRF